MSSPRYNHNCPHGIFRADDCYPCQAHGCHAIENNLASRLEAAEVKVKELEEERTPRPMGEAPQDGTPILIKCKFGWSVGYRKPEHPTVWHLHGWFSVDWVDSYCLGWLPLPDKDTP